MLVKDEFKQLYKDYDKITATMSGEELSNDEMFAAAGELYNNEVNKFDGS